MSQTQVRKYMMVGLWGALACSGAPVDPPGGNGVGGQPMAGAINSAGGGASGSGGDPSSAGGSSAGGSNDGLNGGAGAGASPCGPNGGAGQSSSCQLPIDPTCDTTGTWHVTYAFQPPPSGGGSNSGPMFPMARPTDTLVITKTAAGEHTAAFGRGPRAQTCGGSSDGTVGTYSIAVELSGPCRLKVTEVSGYDVCFEPYTEGLILELDVSDDEAVGTASTSQGCVCEPKTTASYSVQATRE